MLLCLLAGLAAHAAAHTPESLPPATAVPAGDRVLTLERATELATSNSPVIGQARAKVDQAQGLMVQAGLYPNPVQNSGNPNQLGGDNSLYSVGFSQEVVRAGKIQLNQSAAEQSLRQSQFEFIRQQFEVITAVRQQFFTLLAAQQRVKTLLELKKIAQQSEDISIRLQQGEQGTRTDVLLLRVELRRIEVSLRAAQFVRTAAAQQLASLIGLPNLPIEGVIGDLSLKLPNFNDPNIRQQLLRAARWSKARGPISRGRSSCCAVPRSSRPPT